MVGRTYTIATFAVARWRKLTFVAIVYVRGAVSTIKRLESAGIWPVKSQIARLIEQAPKLLDRFYTTSQFEKKKTLLA